MNLNTILDRYADDLDRIGKRRGIGAREDTAIALVLEGIIAELGAEDRPGRPPITPATIGHPVDAARFARDRQHARDQDDAAILRLLGRR